MFKTLLLIYYFIYFASYSSHLEIDAAAGATLNLPAIKVYLREKTLCLASTHDYVSKS